MQFSRYILNNLNGGDEEARTPDPLRARQVLSQLSYAPILKYFLLQTTLLFFVCTQSRTIVRSFTQPKSRLVFLVKYYFIYYSIVKNSLALSSLEPSRLNSRIFLPRKEVIQPHLPVRLPCYDFTPVTGFALGSFLLAVR